ncbi:polyphosphate kinase 2 family protein [Oerskovia turbata]|uniref:Polyphosphate kinase 2 family protein n=1 Tax=Oerskovia turbata TaxID=1713 RepID=A0A4Q1KXX3_9CELL|nr:polyphosphate kinase 2 family protein [Oerskovia turbata]RXR24739.1 polyphosphate kinase 2 family protein [Oerskovia turbata]RXR35057.1 polyphosphate kinase 2 family protein [Oerskovia turbata]TGJ97124.1 polyphosphate kinase 2 family protein [Actinotalea fermentans ATCC 43279 = JCM 9966 = DSM 3133]
MGKHSSGSTVPARPPAEVLVDPAARRARSRTGDERSLDWDVPPVEALRAPRGLDLATFDRAATPGWSQGRKQAERLLDAHADELSELQERLFAEGRSGGGRSVLLVLQGMDTAGKGGIVRHVIGLVDPQGVQHTSFGVPTAEEREHDFLWRIRRALPDPGYLGVFDRSHYEDVLVARVDELVPPDVWEARYDQINAFEAELVAAGTTVVKVALFVSLDEQKARLRERLERPEKHWKYDPGDIDARRRWPAYQEAYQAAIERTSTEVAPWYVIPADSKWFARVAVSELVLDALRRLDLGWPPADFDVATELRRLESA